MCPLRLILIFLSATLAGFFVIRNLKSQSEEIFDDTVDQNAVNHTSESDSFRRQSSKKVISAIESGFWTFVDMASGRYLWKHLVSSSNRSD